MTRALLVTIALAVMPCVLAQSGEGWKLEALLAGWFPRGGHTTEVFNNRLWLVSGASTAVNPITDAWSSADGATWELEQPTLPWGSSRSDHAMVVFNNRLWIFGGTAPSDNNEVWSSSDGVDWVQETAAAPWIGRRHHAAIVFNGRIWLMGGITRQNQVYMLLNDVWSTADGKNWTQEANATWTGRAYLTTAVFDNRMWVFGGSTTNDVWSTVDGTTWVLETASPPWNYRGGHSTVVYRGRVWVIGGYNGFFLHNDCWSSPDGVNWKLEVANAPWTARGRHSASVFRGRIWLTGGVADFLPMNDVWSYGLHASPDVLPDGVVGHPYSALLEAREGDGPFGWALTGGSLPPGLALDTSTTAATLPITGTPSQVGAFNFTIHLTDNNGYTAEQQITIQINPPPPLKGESSGGSSGCALQHVPTPAWLLLPAAVAWFRRRRPVAR